MARSTATRSSRRAEGAVVYRATTRPEGYPATPIFEYRDGAGGFIRWCNEKVRVKIYPIGSNIPQWCLMGELPDTKHPVTGRSYKYMWEEQQEILKQALVMKDNVFVHSNIILNWPRGEGKSVIVCLIQLWKFFNFPAQMIVLGANSKEQIKFVHYDIIQDIILNSPHLLYDIGGENNIQAKEIRLLDGRGNVVSTIRAISSFTGIVSNITGYTFSEMFAMKNPSFFTQLDGSIRNVPNALGTIDSTVSSKQHVLYKMYVEKMKGEPGTESIFYSYRCSATVDMSNYWHPYMTDTQLVSYQTKFPFGEFERYFQNLWSAGRSRVFSDEQIQAIHVLGCDGGIGNHVKVMELLEHRTRALEGMAPIIERMPEAYEDHVEELARFEKRLRKIDEIYKLEGISGVEARATLRDLTVLGDLYDTNWAILVGLDRADPMKVSKLPARTIVSCLAKGLPGSRSRPDLLFDANRVPYYLFVRLFIGVVESHSLEGIKEYVTWCHQEFEGIDAVCGERWGLYDLAPWCEQEGIHCELLFPTYDKQRACFGELYGAADKGLLKSPTVPIPGSKTEDLQDEEMQMFDHDPDRKWFGSIEKDDKYGVQDDFMFATGWTVYGGREITADQFRERGRSLMQFGFMIEDRSLQGVY